MKVEVGVVYTWYASLGLSDYGGMALQVGGLLRPCGSEERKVCQSMRHVRSRSTNLHDVASGNEVWKLLYRDGMETIHNVHYTTAILILNC